MTQTNLLARLRAETRPQHEALEAGLDLLSPRLDLPRYLRILQGFDAFWRQWQPLAHGLLAAEPDLIRRRDRRPALAVDLHHFGLVAGVAAADGPLPDLDDADAALGSLYVMEGSTLGGQVIARHLEDHLGLRNGKGYRYFLGYGAENGVMWSAMRTRLGAAPAHGPAADRAVTAAAQTFDSLRRRLCT